MYYLLYLYFKRCLYSALIVCIFISPAISAEKYPNWEINYSESRIEFIGKQMGVSTHGRFSDFIAKIEFNLDKPEHSYVKIIINTKEITTSYEVLNEVLKSKPWFDVKMYPNAIFETDNIKKIGNVGSGNFLAEGTLTIRGIQKPAKFQFTVTPHIKTNLNEAMPLSYIDGNFTVKRLSFGIGQGEWGDSSIVDDEVKVKVHLLAQKLN